MLQHRIQRLAGLAAAGLLLATQAAILPADQALAQRQGFGGRGMSMLNSPGINQLMLLRNESVGADLKLTDEQKTKSNAIVDKVQGEIQDKLTELGGLDEDERAEMLKELRSTAQERGKAVLSELAGVLQPEQFTRPKQINLQLRGAQALSDEEIAAELKLSDEQKKQLVTINEENDKAMNDLRQEARGSDDRQAVFAKMQELRKAAGDKALAVLTADQKAQFDKLQGPKADIKFEGPPGGGRGRRPQGD